MSPNKNKKPALPSEIYAMGIKFRVELVDKIDHEGSVGETLGELRIIRIDSNQDTRRQWTTLLHEYMHACLHVIGYANEAVHEVEEIVVQTTEHAIEMFMLSHGHSFLSAIEVQK
jgi:hypothetical protein